MEIRVVAGRVNSGKTSLMEKLAEKEREKGNLPTGILAPGIYREGIKAGFDVRDITTGETEKLARIRKKGKKPQGFVFFDAGFDFAGRALREFNSGGSAFLDEAGPLELSGGGHYESLLYLLESDLSRLYVSVRENCLGRFRDKFIRKHHNVKIIRVSEPE